MKKEYMKPTMIVVTIQATSLLSGSGDQVYGDKQVSGAYQLSRESGDWDDDEEDSDY